MADVPGQREQRKENESTEPRTLSVTFTVLIWAGIALAIFGAIVAILGVGGAAAFDGKIGSIEVKTGSVGLAILVVGLIFAGTIALRLPRNVRVLARARKRSLTERIARRAPLFFLAGIIGCILLVLSFFVR